MATTMVETRARRYDPSETRQRVLEAANMLFSTKGYVATGTADIAREADVSEGSIFYHFGSKRNLLAELGRRYGEQMVAAMHREGEDLADLEPGITVARCFEFCETHREWDAIKGVDTRCSKGDHSHDPESEPFHREARKVIVAFIERVLYAKQARDGGPAYNIPVTASLTHAAVGEGLDMAFRSGSPAEREAVMAETIRFIRAAAWGCRGEDSGAVP